MSSTRPGPERLTTQAPVVQVAGASKAFGRQVALAGVDLTVHPGELVVLLGPSGCGKTTLLRSVAGLEQLDAGSISFSDVDHTRAEPQDRPVGLVFQDFALYPHKTVYDNIALGLRVRKWPKDRIEARVKEVATLLHIEELLGRYPRQLSGGQKQRVGIGRALSRSPQVLLMDEPLSNLDAKLRLEMRRELSSLRRQLTDTGIIYVTHDQEEAMTLADRLVVMNDGLIVQSGTSGQLYREPEELFVAGFVGSPPINTVLLDDGVTVAVRPEHLSLVEELSGGPALGFGRLNDVEHLGHDAVARYLVNGSEVSVRVSEISAPLDQGWLTFETDQALFFDANGRRVRDSGQLRVLRAAAAARESWGTLNDSGR